MPKAFVGCPCGNPACFYRHAWCACGGLRAKRAKVCWGCYMAQPQDTRRSPSALATGADRPNWKGDDATTAVKRSRAQRTYPLDGVTCEWADCEDSAVDRHHIDGNTGNNRRSNIALVCRRHHMEWDGRLEAFRNLARDNNARRRVAAGVIPDHPAPSVQ